MDEENEYRKAKPYLRSLTALLIFLRYPGVGEAGSYKVADYFIASLEKDLQED